jgi:hypothetical protein
MEPIWSVVLFGGRGTGRATSSLALETHASPKDPSAELQPKSAILSCCSMMEREELVMTTYQRIDHGKAFHRIQICDVTPVQAKPLRRLVETFVSTTPGFLTVFVHYLRYQFANDQFPIGPSNSRPLQDPCFEEQCCNQEHEHNGIIDHYTTRRWHWLSDPV